MKTLRQQQAEFAAHIRNPDKNPGPQGIEERRLNVYTELFYNNIEGFISNGFPVLNKILDEQQWHQMIRDFVENHTCHSPYFLEISEEFLRYLEDDSLPVNQQYRFVPSLAHYEWVELALDVKDQFQDDIYDANGDLMEGRPLVSALAWPLVYDWPVHMIGKDYLPEEPAEQPVCLVVYRNRKEDVAFMEANPVTLRLLEIINNNSNLTGLQALQQIAGEMQKPGDQGIINFGKQTLDKLHELGIILGTRLS